MISGKLLVYLAIGTLAMLVPIAYQVRWNNKPLWKSVPISLALTVCGTLRTYIWFFMENGWIGGTSFYGAVFVVPVLFLPLAKAFRVPYRELLDLCAPAECVMLAIMKVQCQISGCCSGRALFTTDNGTVVYFPSQIAEMINAIIIFAVLMVFAYKKIERGNLYLWYMTIYGTSRLILNFLRAEHSDFLLGLPPGHIWSVLAIAVGVMWLLVSKKRALRCARRPCHAPDDEKTE